MSRAVAWACASLALAAAAAPSPEENAFSAYVLATHIRSRGYVHSPAPFVPRREALGFRLADDMGCRTPGEDRGYCDAARPKPWTQDELRRMAAMLEELRASGLERFLGRVRANGFDTMLRETYVVHQAGTLWRPLPYPNSIHTNRQLLIADRRLHSGGERPLLHLLAHAYDFADRRGSFFFPTFSHAPYFLRLTGFFVNERGEWELIGMPRAQRALYRDLFERTNRELLRAGALKDRRGRERREAAIRERAERFARPYGAPSFHALLNPYEAFAEWTVLVHLDPQRARALNPDLARWIRENVLAAPEPPSTAAATQPDGKKNPGSQRPIPPY